MQSIIQLTNCLSGAEVSRVEKDARKPPEKPIAKGRRPTQSDKLKDGESKKKRSNIFYQRILILN